MGSDHRVLVLAVLCGCFQLSRLWRGTISINPSPPGWPVISEPPNLMVPYLYFQSEDGFTKTTV